ncbi:MAG: hypothetical protein VZR75_04735, partial [Candidatus Enteromonas sp.]|nr:hypothetical protein [Candidatus Enteromonas sp.]
EEWAIANHSYDIEKFTFSLEKMSLDGALFDMDKLNYFAKEIMASIPVEELAANVKAWASTHDHELFKRIIDDEGYFKKILNIERDRPNPRKDYAKYSDIYHSPSSSTMTNGRRCSMPVSHSRRSMTRRPSPNS